MSKLIALSSCLSGLALLACASSQPAPVSEPPPTSAGPVEPVPVEVSPGEVAERPSITAEQCQAAGGSVVGDIGDGATQRPDYVCPSGAAPSGNISAPPGGPIGVEGAVCCPGATSSSSSEGTTAPGGASWVTQPPAVNVDDAWRKCSADDECLLVETACCDHCNGGKAVAVNKAHEKDAAKLRPKCGPTMCTKRACLTRAACENGACVLQSPGGMP